MQLSPQERHEAYFA